MSGTFPHETVCVTPGHAGCPIRDVPLRHAATRDRPREGDLRLILRDTFSLLGRALPVVAVLVLVPSVVQGLGLDLGIWVEALLLLLASYALYRRLLLDEGLFIHPADRRGPPAASARFLALGAGLALLSGALTLGLMELAAAGLRGMQAAGIAAHDPALAAELSGLGPVRAAMALPTAMTFGGLIDGSLAISAGAPVPLRTGSAIMAQLLVLGLFGTLLPAVAVQSIWGPGLLRKGYAARQARMAAQLLAGPVLIGLLLLAGLLALRHALPPLPDPARPASTLPGLGLAMAARLAGAALLAMMVVITSRVYLGMSPDPVPEPEAEAEEPSLY